MSKGAGFLRGAVQAEMLFGLPVTFNCRYRCRLFLFCFSAPADCIIAEQVVVDGGSVVCNYLYVIVLESEIPVPYFREAGYVKQEQWVLPC